MSMDWFRDLIISISGVVLIGVLIFIAVLSYTLYRRAKSILDSIRATTKTIQGISCLGGEIIKPIIPVVAFIQGIRQASETIGKLFKRKGG